MHIHSRGDYLFLSLEDMEDGEDYEVGSYGKKRSGLDVGPFSVMERFPKITGNWEAVCSGPPKAYTRVHRRK